MFLANLSEQQKIQFFLIARFFALMDDGQIDDGEQNLLNSMKAEMGLVSIDESQLPTSPATLERLGDIFFSKKSRKVLIIELLGIAYTHGVIDQKQKDFLVDLAKSFSFSAEELDSMEKWVVEMLHLTATGFQMVNS